MVALDGKYVLVENQNFLDLLLKSGIPAEAAQKANEDKPSVTVKKSAHTISITVESSFSGNETTDYILNKEIDEVMCGVALKSVATLDGNVLTVTSKSTIGHAGKTVYTFSDSGFELVHISEDGGQAKRIYKRK